MYILVQKNSIAIPIVIYPYILILQLFHIYCVVYKISDLIENNPHIFHEFRKTEILNIGKPMYARCQVHQFYVSAV